MCESTTALWMQVQGGKSTTSITRGIKSNQDFCDGVNYKMNELQQSNQWTSNYTTLITYITDFALY